MHKIYHFIFTGISTNANNYLTNQCKASTSTDVPRTSNGPPNNAPPVSNGNYTNNVKATSSISRPLQNVCLSFFYKNKIKKNIYINIYIYF